MAEVLYENSNQMTLDKMGFDPNFYVLANPSQRWQEVMMPGPCLAGPYRNSGFALMPFKYDRTFFLLTYAAAAPPKPARLVLTIAASTKAMFAAGINDPGASSGADVFAPGTKTKGDTNLGVNGGMVQGQNVVFQVRGLSAHFEPPALLPADNGTPGAVASDAATDSYTPRIVERMARELYLEYSMGSINGCTQGYGPVAFQRQLNGPTLGNTNGPNLGIPGNGYDYMPGQFFYETSAPNDSDRVQLNVALTRDLEFNEDPNNLLPVGQNWVIPFGAQLMGIAKCRTYDPTACSSIDTVSRRELMELRELVKKNGLVP